MGVPEDSSLSGARDLICSCSGSVYSPWKMVDDGRTQTQDGSTTSVTHPHSTAVALDTFMRLHWHALERRGDRHRGLSRQGYTAWKPALPLWRVAPQPVDLAGHPVKAFRSGLGRDWRKKCGTAIATMHCAPGR